MDLSHLKRLCNDRSFARGEAYFNEGRVQSLAEHEGVLTAVVSGQKDYRVKLGRMIVRLSIRATVRWDLMASLANISWRQVWPGSIRI
jgi:uncharacterized Zn finger protein